MVGVQVHQPTRSHRPTQRPTWRRATVPLTASKRRAPGPRVGGSTHHGPKEAGLSRSSAVVTASNLFHAYPLCVKYTSRARPSKHHPSRYCKNLVGWQCIAGWAMNWPLRFRSLFRGDCRAQFFRSSSLTHIRPNSMATKTPIRRGPNIGSDCYKSPPIQLQR